MSEPGLLYWLIVYQWRGTSGLFVVSNAVHVGPLWAWVLRSKQQPEEWVLLNAISITQADYVALDGVLG